MSNSRAAPQTPRAEAGFGHVYSGIRGTADRRNSGRKERRNRCLPEEYHAKDLAGEEAVFHCLVHEIKEEQLPELDDEFAKDVSRYDTLEELKRQLRKRLQKYIKAGAETRCRTPALKLR